MKRVLVTGGSRGLGLAVVRRLVASGWSVVAVARAESSELRQLAGEVGRQLRFVAADLSAPDAVARLTVEAGLLDGFDALVANAAIGLDGLLTLTSEPDLRRTVEVNLVAPMLLAREVLKGMLQRGRGGALVFVSSIAARTGFTGLAVYGATKGGLVAFSRSLAREYGPRGIRSNCVLPGFLATDMTASLPADQRERLVRRTPLGRLGDAADVTGAVSYLLSDEARHVTGTELVVDGGITA